jgi:hypothetical protein
MIKKIVIIVLLIILGIGVVILRLDMAVGQTFIPMNYLLPIVSVVAAILGLYILFFGSSIFHDDE